MFFSVTYCSLMLKYINANMRKLMLPAINDRPTGIHYTMFTRCTSNKTTTIKPINNPKNLKQNVLSLFYVTVPLCKTQTRSMLH